MEAIEKRFGGNKESKKTQKTLLKQQYENFNRSSSEGLDQTYDRLQKLISQLEILGETISQEDMNLKFLRSLPSEWKTHTLIWRNKPDLETLSMDDLYNNLKIYETEVKGSSSSSQNSQNVAFVSSNSSGSTNQAHGSNSANTDSMSDVVIYSFFANQSNSPKISARRFLNKTGRKISANGSETIGFNKSKVECYNCHKKGHFARECRAPRENRNREPIRRNVTVETTEAKALVAQDGLGYDWSDQAEEGPTNFAFMAYTSSSSSSSDSEVSTCSKACLKSYETLKEHYDNLTKDFNKSQLNVGAYKAGLESVEARLDVYKKNEAVFEEDIKILKLDVMLRDNALTELRKKFEKAEKERDDLKLTLKKFENSSKNLSKLLEIQVSDKFKTGVGFDSQVFDSQENDKYKTSEGYHVVPPPYTGNFMPPKSDLVLADEDEYVFSESVTSVPDVATSEAKSSESKPKTVSEPLIEDWISDSEDENETKSKSKQRKSSFAKVEFVKSNEHVKTPKESDKKVENNKQAKYPRKNSQSPRGNQRNWNNLMTQKLGSNFEFKNKACYVCGSFNHLIKDCDFYEKKMAEKPVWNNARRVNHQNSQRLTHPHSKRNFVPRAVLMKSGLKTLNTARQNSSRAAVNTARPINTAYPRPTVNCARPSSNVFNRAHSHVRRPFNKFTTNKNSNFNEKVNTVRGNVTTVGPKAVVSDNKGHEANVVKASACWVWRPKQKVLDHVSRHNGASMNFKRFDYGNPQLELQEKGVIDSGCSRHMTGNKSYLSNYEEIDGGFVAFGGSTKGGKITGKGKIKTGKLDFKDVYFVKELKFNLFSVSQMCDKKNNVLFTDTECVVLSPDFKLLDENQVLLRVPRKNNMYSVDLKNVAPSGGLTCLFTKATLDESNLWHRRLGHINFKTMNKLVRGNLVRGLPSKIFENDHTCVACQKGKQHKASCKTKTNKEMNQFCEMKGIKREFSVARTPQQNGVAERKNRTLIEVARTILAYSKLPTTFRAEAVYTACYVQIYGCADDPNMPNLEEIVYSKDDEGVGAEVDMNNLDTFMHYVDEILKKFGFSTMKTASTPMETLKPLMKDENAEDVDVHLYRSMISSLMYLTSSRPDIMFVCICCDSPFDLEAYTNSDYVSASLDRKFTIGVANSTTKAEHVAASNCCGQVLWIQNQLLDYGYNFMNTKIFIDNESTICIVKNLVFHSKTKHIEIRHHFIRDSYEKRLIQVIKIHTDHNVADLLTKAFDVSRFQYLIARWLEWSAKAAKDEIEVKTGNSKVNAVGHYLVLLGES
ncbi:putative ribonuclease H-like domain-containing protein [Tanacetum coccineum]